VAALGSAASANRLPSYDTHTLSTPEYALGSYYYTTDDEGWPRARVCLVHVPSAVPVPVGFPTLLANTDRSRPSFCLVFQVLLVHHSFARDHTVAFLSARGQRTSKHLSHHVKVQVTCTRLGSDRATSHVSMIVFAISLSGDFLVVSSSEAALSRELPASYCQCAAISESSSQDLLPPQNRTRPDRS